MEYQQGELNDYDEHIKMTLKVVEELEAKKKDSNYKMKLVQNEEEKYFRELFEKGDIETIVDLILIAKNKKELELKLSEKENKNTKTKAVENVRCSNSLSPLPIFNARKRRVPDCKILLRIVNIETKLPTTVYVQ